MIILACVGILSLVLGTAGAAFRRDRTALKALGGPLVGLIVILAMGRTIAGAHLPLMGSIVLWAAWTSQTTARPFNYFGIVAAAGLGSALIAGLFLF